MSNSTMDFQNRSLQQQGYTQYSEVELNNLRWGLRFTPSVCMVGAVIGLVLHLPYLHFALAVLGIAPMWFPASHPLDRFYNSVVRNIVGGVKLPPNPLPRRIACFAGGAMNVVVGLCFLGGLPTLAYVVGGALIVLQLIVNTTHFCVASWMWEAMLKLLGMWQPFASAMQIQSALSLGAVLVDVREGHEFEKGHLAGATNIPLSIIQADASRYSGEHFLLYCQSGMRSQEAVGLLQKHGDTQSLNMGGMDEARTKLEKS